MIDEAKEPQDIRAYLRPVLKRWWLILAIVPVVTVGAYLYYDHQPESYAASTQLFVQTSPVAQLLNGGNAQFSNEATAENLTRLIPTRAVGAQAEKFLPKGATPQGSVGAEREPESSFFAITATASTPGGAAALANAYAKAIVQIQQNQLHGEAKQTLRLAEKQLAKLPRGEAHLIKRAALEEQIQTLQLVSAQTGDATGIKVVERAFPVATPLNHDPLSHAVFAFVLSLVLVVAAAFGFEYLNRKFGSVDDVEEVFAPVPILTEVPKVNKPAPVAGDGAAIDKDLYEPFHRLQMNLDMLSQQRPLRTILIASAIPGEGKSVVTRNLALAFREAGRNVAVLDADFRKASLGGLLQAQEGPGLADILAGRASFGDTVQEVAVGNGAVPAHPQGAVAAPPATKGDLAMVPAGAQKGDLAATLASGGMRQALATAVGIYDRVIVDSSPILATADVLPLLSEVDGVLLVTRLGVTTRNAARRLLAELERTETPVVGVVVNGIPRRIYRTRSYGYYYG